MPPNGSILEAIDVILRVDEEAELCVHQDERRKRGRTVRAEDFSGRVEAAMSVVLKARVTGYLEQVRVADGAEVKAGDVLFEIDARPYQTELAKVEADLRLLHEGMGCALRQA